MNRRKVMYIYKNSHCPRHGWLQGCFICSSITGNSIDYEMEPNYEDLRYEVYICRSCDRKRLDNTLLGEAFIRQVDDYITLATG